MAIPVINIVDFDRTIISNQFGYEQSLVTFEFDQNLQSWEARADGAGVGQGLKVGGGSNVVTLRLNEISGSLNTVKNTFTDLYSMSWGQAQFLVKDEELTSGDKTYRINVYGQNTEGAWNGYVG